MNYKKLTVLLGVFALVFMTNLAMKPIENAPSLKLALLKYNGGGDWYANPSALVNLSLFCNKFLNTNFDPNYETVEVGSIDLYNYPFLHMTGHGNVVFSSQEADNLRTYLTSGGFLHIDDNYGMDPYVRVAMKSVFPELEFVEVPFNHGIYHQKYEFPGGLPKIHKHDDRAPKGYGLFWQGRLVCYYSFECDLGDGWEDPEVHKDPEELRIKALRMGSNLVQYVFRA
ncbi:MAG: DUF4159 domain-containing protein [Saprospiraceae bacterium]|nr:DUF4159 domain-containing protein [Saprospiraceae bacterium]